MITGSTGTDFLLVLVWIISPTMHSTTNPYYDKYELLLLCLGWPGQSGDWNWLLEVVAVLMADASKNLFHLLEHEEGFFHIMLAFSSSAHFNLCWVQTRFSKLLDWNGTVYDSPEAGYAFCFATKCKTKLAPKAIDKTCLHDPRWHTGAKLAMILLYRSTSWSWHKRRVRSLGNRGCAMIDEWIRRIRSPCHVH